MVSCRNTDRDDSLLALRQAENSEGLPALQTQSSETLFLKRASTIHPTGGTSRCAWLKRPVSLEDGATNLVRRLSLAFHGVVLFSFTLGRVAPPDDTLSWRFCGLSNGRIYSSWKLPVAESASSARAESRLVCFCKTRVVGTTF